MAATYTTYLNLKKPDGNENFDILNDFNANWDKIDAAIGSRQYNLGMLTNATIESQMGTFASAHKGESNFTGSFYISASAIPSDLPEQTNEWKYAYGLFRIRLVTNAGVYDGDVILFGFNTSNIAVRHVGNSVMASSWLQVAKAIKFGTSSKTIEQNLADDWTTYIPNDGAPHLVQINAQYGVCVGFLQRYSNSYGSGCLTRYEGSLFRVTLDNGTVSCDSIFSYDVAAAAGVSPTNFSETLYNCEGTIVSHLRYHRSGKIVLIEGRLTINNYRRTGGTPGFQITLPNGLKSKRAINIVAAGINGLFNGDEKIFSLGENTQFGVTQGSGTISITTTESYVNFGGSGTYTRAVFQVFPVYVEVE